MKRVISKGDKKKKAQDALIKEPHRTYLSVVGTYLDKAAMTLEDPSLEKTLKKIGEYIVHGKPEIDQIEHRILRGEAIPHDETVFSIFEEHTEWISKGKAEGPVELGLKVCILEDQYRFILHHRVMEKETDEQVAVLMLKEGKKRHDPLSQCSFDKGFHSPSNLLEHVLLPWKGKLSEAFKSHEHGVSIKARHHHSAVESVVINALEVHGLDRCEDHGISGFKRYGALAIVARNIQKPGVIL